jgi:hypothetical protein
VEAEPEPEHGGILFDAARLAHEDLEALENPFYITDTSPEARRRCRRVPSANASGQDPGVIVRKRRKVDFREQGKHLRWFEHVGSPPICLSCEKIRHERGHGLASVACRHAFILAGGSLSQKLS